jgi:ABC-2 type transport system ATP-binding protein
MIEAKGLTKRFGDFEAVKNLTLSVPPGTIFGFLGPNGSGKSTTVKMMTGLLKPTAGDAVIGGLSITANALEAKRIIGVLPEGNALFHSLSIWEHLMLCGSIYGIPKADTEARAEQLLRVLDLWEARDTYADQTSFGMGKKCSLAMALLHNPKVLFLDEPFEGIDPVSSRNIKDLLMLLTQRGVTIFLTSHILEIAEQLIQNFAIIVRGEIVHQGAMTGAGNLETLYFQYVERAPMGDLSWIG